MHSFLVISDDSSVHNFLRKSLERDAIVLSAKTTKEALQILLDKEIDVAFFDVFLNDNTIHELVDGLRDVKIEPTIVALIPSARPMLFEEALGIGADELLEKPLKKAAVQRVSKRALEKQELKRELGFVQSQINELKPTGKDNGFLEYPFLKQTGTNGLHLTYKEIFQKFSRVLTHVDDLGKLADLTVEAMAEIFRVGRVIFMLIDREEATSRPYRCLGIDEVAARSLCFPTYRGTVSWLFKNHQILNKDVLDKEVVTNKLTRREALNIQKEMGLLQAQLCIPIFAKGNLVSVIALGNKITGKAFFDEDIELLSMLVGYIGMAVENALLYKEVYLRKIHNENVLENIPCGVIAINNDCMVNIFNKSAAKMLDISPHDVLKKNVKHIGSIFADVILRTLKDKKTYKMREIVRPETHCIYAVSTSLLDTNGELGAIMVLSDLSEIRKLESRVKDLEKQAFYHTLSTNIAHYIKNHLVSLKTFMTLLPEKLKEKEFVEHFSPIALQELNKLDLMVERLTTLGENKSLMQRRVELRLLVDQVLDHCKEEMTKSGIKLIKKYSEAPAITWGDCEKIEEAFSNIILNAIEAMPNGGMLTVTLSKTLLDEKKLMELYHSSNNGAFLGKYYRAKDSTQFHPRYTEIIIEDTGGGISQEQLYNIFQPFYTTKAHNIGLGLSIAQRVIEEHFGFIYVSSNIGKGSNIHILLPIRGSE